MIRNQHQYRIAQRKLRELLQSASESIDPVDADQYTRLADDIQGEIEEYERIRSGRQNSFKIESFDDLVDVAIKARIANDWTQAQLADELGVSEQQVQKDEANGYQRASWERVADVLDALDYELVGHVRPRGADPQPADHVYLELGQVLLGSPGAQVMVTDSFLTGVAGEQEIASHTSSSRHVLRILKTMGRHDLVADLAELTDLHGMTDEDDERGADDAGWGAVLLTEPM